MNQTWISDNYFYLHPHILSVSWTWLIQLPEAHLIVWLVRSGWPLTSKSWLTLHANCAKYSANLQGSKDTALLGVAGWLVELIKRIFCPGTLVFILIRPFLLIMLWLRSLMLLQTRSGSWCVLSASGSSCLQLPLHNRSDIQRIAENPRHPLPKTALHKDRKLLLPYRHLLFTATDQETQRFHCFSLSNKHTSYLFHCQRLKL